ncbi:MAG: MFS transporter [Pseudomonadota bacterium]
MGGNLESAILMGPANPAASIPFHDRAMVFRIAGLYMIQGIPLGLGFEAIPTLLRDAGTPLASLAWLPLIGLPWMFNLFWAPIIDGRWNSKIGKRRSWIIPMHIGLVIGLCALALIPFTPDNVSIILIIATVTSLFGATQDIAVDGLAAESLPTEALGGANAAQVGGMAIGLLLGGAGVMIAVDQFGQFIALSLLAALVLLALTPVLFWQENTSASKTMHSKARIWWFFSRQFAASVLWLGLIATISGTVLHALWRLILVDFGWTPSEIGLYSALGYTGVMALASILAPLLLKRFGERRIGVLGIMFAGLAGLGWAAIANDSLAAVPYIIGPLIAMAGIGISLSSVVVFSVVMRFAQAGDQPGTDFTVFQSSHVLGGGIASSIAIGISGAFGYLAGLTLGIGVCVLAIITLLSVSGHLFQSVERGQ